MNILQKYNLELVTKSMRLNLPLENKKFYAYDILRSIISQHIVPERIRLNEIPEIRNVQTGGKTKHFFASDSGFILVEEKRSLVYDLSLIHI